MTKPQTRATTSNLSSQPLSLSCTDLREDNPLKRSRFDLGKHGDQITTLDDLLVRMQTMFDDTNHNIETTVQSCKDELRKDIGCIREEMLIFEAKLEKMASTVKEIRGAVHGNTELIRANEKANDLLLSGVPYTNNENVRVFGEKIAAQLGYTERDVPLICAKRLAREPIAVGSTAPILLQFAFKINRDEFFQRYLGTRNLSLTHLGFNVNKRMFLNENLSRLARQIKGNAVKLKKAGRLHSVYTKDGVVHVKQTPDAKPEPIYTVDQLAE